MTVASAADDRTAPGSPTAAIRPPATRTAPGSAPSTPRSSLPMTMVSPEGPGRRSHRSADSTARGARPRRAAARTNVAGSPAPPAFAAADRPSSPRPPPGDNGAASTITLTTPGKNTPCKTIALLSSRCRRGPARGTVPSRPGRPRHPSYRSLRCRPATRRARRPGQDRPACCPVSRLACLRRSLRAAAPRWSPRPQTAPDGAPRGPAARHNRGRGRP